MDSKDQHITWSEAEEVVRLHRLKSCMSDTISLDALAGALGEDHVNTRAMLAEVRDARRRRKRVVIDRGGIIGVAIAVVVVLGYLGYLDFNSPYPTRGSDQSGVGRPLNPKLMAKHRMVWPSMTQYHVSERRL